MRKNALLLLFLSLSTALFFTACDDETGEVQPDAHEGIVRDYSGLDGCGYIIEMLNGDKLEPVEMADSTSRFYNGQHVAVWYTDLPNAGSFCMAGKTVRIDSIRPLGCDALTDWSADLPHDPFIVEKAYIEGNCLVLHLCYGGGCQPHDFFLSRLPTMSPLPAVTLSHDAHGDCCEALIHQTRSFDLTPLQSPGTHSVIFILTLNIEGSSFRKELTYHY